MNWFEGKITGQGKKIGIVLSKFNSFIGDKLLEGARNAFYQMGGEDGDLTICKVPGAYEIPGMARRLIRTNRYDAVICLGVIIQGQTPHFEYVAGNSAKAIMELSAHGDVPVIYGLITASDVEQAIDRAGVKVGNKGYDAVMTALEMVDVYQQVEE